MGKASARRRDENAVMENVREPSKTMLAPLGAAG